MDNLSDGAEFSFEPLKVEVFYNWLKTEAAKSTSSHNKINIFFNLMDINTAQKEQASLLIQHRIGLGLRELAKQHFSKPDTGAEHLEPWDNLRKVFLSPEGNKKYGKVNGEYIIDLVELFGINKPEIKTQGNEAILCFAEGKNIIQSGQGESEHFEAEDYKTLGDGNCAFNALAQKFAADIGLNMLEATPESQLDYLEGKYIPSPSHAASLKVDVENKTTAVVTELVNQYALRELQTIQKNKELDVMVAAAGFDLKDTSDGSLQAFIDDQKAIYEKIQSLRPFHAACSKQSNFADPNSEISGLQSP